MITSRIRNVCENMPSPNKISIVPYFQRFCTLDFNISAAAKKAITAISVFSVEKVLVLCVATFAVLDTVFAVCVISVVLCNPVSKKIPTISNNTHITVSNLTTWGETAALGCK